MDPNPADLRSIFGEAIERPPGAGRAAFLDEACRGDRALRSRVEALIAALEGAGDFLADPSSAGTIEGGRAGATFETAGLDAPPAEGVGTRIGPYKILQAIGEGGMGTVFMADQEEPVRRRVALKVIRAGMDSSQVVARFEAERQALAMMDHPNIARVLDAGSTAAGRPYIAMELVKGVPITRYCDEARLSTKGRLDLFVPVCQAVQHAHRKGIIHRDLKPSNVLVTLVDGRPMPKVIDFGVAKAVDQRLTERTIVTQFGAVVGTPEYMSPEQAEISALDVDTRSDVYSLGVLLYELLTGETPLDREAVRRAAFVEVLRRIREEDPVPPSTRMSRSGERLSSLSALRNTDPGKLARSLRGDLDWIVMKALEKDRSRRYDSPAELARDVERHLAGDVVEARSPSARYRLAKLARKHRAALATAAAFVALLTAATAVSSWMAVRATQARQEAEAVSRFLLDLFAKPDPTRRDARGPLRSTTFLEEAERRVRSDGAISGPARDAVAGLLRRASYSGADRPVVELLASGLHRLDADRSLPPLTKASLYRALGRTSSALGRGAAAEGAFRRSFEICEPRLGPSHRDTLASRINAVDVEAHGVTPASIASLREALRACEEALGPADLLTRLARRRLVFAILGHLPSEAVALAERNVAPPGPEDDEAAFDLQTLAQAYAGTRRLAEAVDLQRRVIARWRDRAGPDHPYTLGAGQVLAWLLAARGEFDQAMALHREVRRGRDARLPPDHPDVFESMIALVDTLEQDGRRDQAVALIHEARDRGAAILDPGHPTLTHLRWVAALYDNRQGDRDALAVLESIAAGINGRVHPDARLRLGDDFVLAEASMWAGRPDDGLALIGSALERGEAAWGPGDPDVLNLRLLRIDALFYLARFDEMQAERGVIVAAQGGEGPLGPSLDYYPAVRAALHEPSPGAVARLRGVVAEMGRLVGPDNRVHLIRRATLADAAFSAGLRDEAEATWSEVLPKLPPEMAYVAAEAGMKSRLGAIHLDRKEFERAEPLIVAAYDDLGSRMALRLPVYEDRPAEVAARVVRLYDEWGKPERAAAWRERVARDGRGG